MASSVRASVRRVAWVAAWSLVFLIVWQSGTGDATAHDPIFPRALAPGDTIMIVAPAGPLESKAVELVEQRLVEAGFKVKIPDNLFRADDYLAGSDDMRATELMRAFTDSTVDAIFPGTGGYGTTRILDRLDYESIRNNPKVFIGFSDITALHLAIHQRTGLITFHSPNPIWGLGSEGNLTWFSAHWFWRAILADRYRQDVDRGALGYTIDAIAANPAAPDQTFADGCRVTPPKCLTPGRGLGRLIGGNLSLIAATMGTPFEIDTRDRILFIEDIGEEPYRVDRMLSTLRLAGKFDQLSGVVLGHFTRRESEDTSDEITTIDDVLVDYFGQLGIPVIQGFPVGHHKCNATLPIGVRCEIDAEAGTLRLLEHPVTVPR